MSKNDGGPAFPSQPIQQMPGVGGIMIEQGGMTLRDWFAGQALAGVCGSPELMATINPGGGDRAIAQACWQMADAMLAERDK